ncbi:MAG TPA: methylmalonyl-CoA mutase family protein [Thermoanaerobaculia bacterium]|nr:methylmalonyl-CoA mutase family protein [Thermoanaerobaculia bacterium]
MSTRRPAAAPAAEFPARGRAAWEELARQTLGTEDLGRLACATADGLAVPPIGFAEDAAELDGLPGAAPFRRAADVTGNRSGWDVRSIVDAASPEECNREALGDLLGGVRSIELRLADPPSREAGVRLRTLDDLDRALADIDLAIAPVALDAGGSFRAPAAMLIALWERRGLAPDEVRGALHADPIGSAARAGAFLPDARSDLASLAELASAVSAALPGVTSARADGLPFHDAGAGDAQELACLLATAVAYLRAMDAAGIAVDAALRQVVLRCALDADFLWGLVKVRALRVLWSRIADASLGTTARTGGAETPPPRIEAITARRGLSALDPWNNLLRAASAMVGAALGGAETLVSLPSVDAAGLPSRELARRLARNLQLVLAEESHLHRVIDPAGGSWALEPMTDRLAEAAWERFQAIEARGGMPAALAEGWIQRHIGETAARRAEHVARRRQVFVGVNDFVDRAVTLAPASSLERPAPSGGASFEALPLRRDAEPFERLREAAREAAESGTGPRVFLARLGTPAESAARAAFVSALLAAGGIAAVDAGSFHDDDELAAALRESGCPVAALCSSDAVYAERAVDAARALRRAGARFVVLAGRPGELEAPLQAAGVDRFLALGGDALDDLAALLAALGVGGTLLPLAGRSQGGGSR